MNKELPKHIERTAEGVLKKHYSVFAATDNSWNKFKESQTYKHALEAMEEYASLLSASTEQGMRWNSGHLWKLKSWIDKMFQQSGLVKYGLTTESEPELIRFYELIDSTYKEEREKWLDESGAPPQGTVEERAKELAIDFAWENILDKGRGYQHFITAFNKWYKANGYHQKKFAGASSTPNPSVQQGEEAVDYKKELEYAMAECKRLSGVAEYWQKKYMEQNPQWQPPKLDNF